MNKEESGGLASCIFENFNKNDFFPKILNICLPEKYIFDNGGRDYLLDINSLSKKISLIKVNNFYNNFL